MIWMLLSCAQNLPYNTLFDGPMASTVVPADQGYWDEPLGFVANRRSGTVIPLDLQHNTALSDQLAAPFLRPRGIAFGSSREIVDIHVDTPAEDRIQIYALDQRTNRLLVAPYIEGMLPEPQIFSPTSTSPEFFDNDASGDSPQLSIISLMPGATTTEEWTVRYDLRKQGWLVNGSQSGLQETILYAETSYISDKEEVSLSLTGRGSDQDHFTFSTDTGIEEIDLGGQVLGMASLDEATLLISVWDNQIMQGSITVYDKRQQSILGQWNAPDMAQLGRIIVQGNQVITSDLQSPNLFVIDLNLADIGSSTFQIIQSLDIVQDLTVIESDEYRHLYVATDQRVDIWDLDEQIWKQINPFEDLRGGIDLFSPIVGITATESPINLQTTTSWLSPERDHVVVATLFNGSTLMLEGSTGCIATIPGGSSLNLDGTNYGEIEFTDTGPTSNPIAFTSENGSMLSTSNCGGVLLDEDWTVRYDGRIGDWVVEGSRSGEQNNRANLDKRYVSDNGAYSFLLVSGGLPPTDGDTFSFSTLSNLLELSLVTNTAGNTEALEVPAKPSTFTDFPHSDGGWDDATPNQYALIPVTNTDVVIRLNLETWIVEHVWN